MTRPVFEPHMRVNVIPGEGVLVWSEEKISALHGRVYELLAPLIDGTRNADELVDALAGQVEGAKVYYALAMLEQNGHVADNSPEIADQTAAFWHGMGIDPRVAIQALGSKRLSVRAVGETDASPLLAALTDINAAIAKAGCAKCSYHLWKVYGTQSGGYNYLWTSSWPGRDVYIKVHQSGDYQAAIKRHQDIGEVMKTQTYNRYVEVNR